MPWKLDNNRPIWPQLSQHLARQIITGVYPPGSRLPSVRELAAEAGVNPNTMQRATAGRLVTQDIGVLEAIRMREAKTVIQDYFEAMASLGYTRERAVSLLKEEFQ